MFLVLKAIAGIALKYMSNPNRIFDIARESAIAHHFTEAWLRGNVEWEVMLFELASVMEKECNRLADANNLREAMTKSQDSLLPNYVLEKSLIPDLFDIKEPLKRQEKLIESIILINEFHKYILSAAIKSITFSSPAWIVKSNNLSDLGYLNYVTGGYDKKSNSDRPA